MKHYTVYMLRCSDNSYYTGVTNSLEHRLWQHAEGIDSDSYTFKRRPFTLVYSAQFRDVRDAISWEKTVKSWSRKKKEALIRGEYEGLPSLSLNLMQRNVSIIQVSTHRVIVRTLEL